MAVGHARLVGGDGGSLSRSGGQRWNWAGWGRWPRNTEKDTIETLIPTFLCLVFNLLRAAFSQIPVEIDQSYCMRENTKEHRILLNFSKSDEHNHSSIVDFLGFLVFFALGFVLGSD